CAAASARQPAKPAPRIIRLGPRAAIATHAISARRIARNTDRSLMMAPRGWGFTPVISSGRSTRVLLTDSGKTLQRPHENPYYYRGEKEPGALARRGSSRSGHWDPARRQRHCPAETRR